MRGVAESFSALKPWIVETLMNILAIFTAHGSENQEWI